MGFTDLEFYCIYYAGFLERDLGGLGGGGGREREC